MLHPSMPCPYPANDRAQGLRGFGIQGKEACCVPSVGGLAIVVQVIYEWDSYLVVGPPKRLIVHLNG